MAKLAGLLVTVDRIEEAGAIIRTDDGQELVVDLELLPEGSHEGARLWLRFDNHQAATLTQEQLTKTLLKEILASRKYAGS